MYFWHSTAATSFRTPESPWTPGSDFMQISNLDLKPDLHMERQTAVVSQRWRPQSQHVQALTQNGGDDAGIVSSSVLVNGLLCQPGIHSLNLGSVYFLCGAEDCMLVLSRPAALVWVCSNWVCFQSTGLNAQLCLCGRWQKEEFLPVMIIAKFTREAINPPKSRIPCPVAVCPVCSQCFYSVFLKIKLNLLPANSSSLISTFSSLHSNTHKHVHPCTSIFVRT